MLGGRFAQFEAGNNETVAGHCWAWETDTKQIMEKSSRDSTLRPPVENWRRVVMIEMLEHRNQQASVSELTSFRRLDLSGGHETGGDSL